MSDTDPVLDAEYRAFIRSLHKDTIDTILAAETWWTPGCFRIVCLGGYDPDDEGSDAKAAAKAIEEQWRSVVHPRLMTLVHGHPDPDVRDAADFLVKRLWSMILLLHRNRGEKEDEDTVAIHLVHDGFKRVHRAAYHAPFRISRPSPRYDGTSIGNTEPLPGRMLQAIRELQAAGALKEGHPILGNGIPQAVERLSDILFMPEEGRAALFDRLNVEDPTMEEPEPNSDALKFGFSFDS